MKKPSTLAQQIESAKATFNSWSPSHQASVRLQGSSAVMTNHGSVPVVSLGNTKPGVKKVPA